MRRQLVVVVVLAVQATAIGAQARRTNPPYLAAMPAPEQVIAAITGADPIDTAARQAGVFWRLRDVIETIARSQGASGQRAPGGQRTADERRLYQQYFEAWAGVWQPVQKALAKDRPRLFKLEGYTVDDDLLDEVLARLGATAVRAEYAKANAAFAALRVRRDQEARAAQAAAVVNRAAAEAELQQLIAENERIAEKRRPLARCLAAGRSESQCVTDALGRDSALLNLYGVARQRPAGLFMTGVYSAARGFSLTFYPDNAAVTCQEVTAVAGYSIERTPTQTGIKLLAPLPETGTPFAGTALISQLLPQMVPANRNEWQRQQVSLTVRADGSLGPTRISPAPATTIDVTGPVAVGTRPGTKIVLEDRGGIVTRRVESADETIYEQRTRSCALGPLMPTAPASPFGSASTALAAGFNLLFDMTSGTSNPASTKLPPPGFRVNGVYTGQSGFEVEFHPETAVIGCRHAYVAREYTVGLKGNQILVTIRNEAAPIVLELGADGTLAGAGQVRVNGRALAGQTANGDLAFQPTTDTCATGVLAPG